MSGLTAKWREGAKSLRKNACHPPSAQQSSGMWRARSQSMASVFEQCADELEAEAESEEVAYEEGVRFGLKMAAEEREGMVLVPVEPAEIEKLKDLLYPSDWYYPPDMDGFRTDKNAGRRGFVGDFIERLIAAQEQQEKCSHPRYKMNIWATSATCRDCGEQWNPQKQEGQD